MARARLATTKTPRRAKKPVGQHVGLKQGQQVQAGMMGAVSNAGRKAASSSGRVKRLVAVLCGLSGLLAGY